MLFVSDTWIQPQTSRTYINGVIRVAATRQGGSNMDQRVDALQGTGKVTLDEIFNNHYLDVASINVDEALPILGVFSRADSTL